MRAWASLGGLGASVSPSVKWGALSSRQAERTQAGGTGRWQGSGRGCWLSSPAAPAGGRASPGVEWFSAWRSLPQFLPAGRTQEGEGPPGATVSHLQHRGRGWLQCPGSPPSTPTVCGGVPVCRRAWCVGRGPGLLPGRLAVSGVPPGCRGGRGVRLECVLLAPCSAPRSDSAGTQAGAPRRPARGCPAGARPARPCALPSWCEHL